MQGTPGKGSGSDHTVGLSLVFFQMSPEFREAVVKWALTWRERVSTEARDGLNRAIDKHVAVDGFRSAGLAPAPIVSGRVSEKAGVADDLAGGVLRVWYESQKVLRETATPYLESCGLSIAELDYFRGKISVGLKDHPLAEAVASFMADHPEANEEEAALAMELMTATFLTDGEDTRGGQVSTVLEAALDVLRQLPADSDAWEEIIPSFLEGVAGTIEEKKSERELAVSLDNLLAGICEEHGGLTEFFQWNARRWFAANLLTGTALQEPHDLATELKGLLAQYAPIHGRAPVASEEMERAKTRLELMPGILEAGNSLDQLMEADDGSGEGPVREMQPRAGELEGEREPEDAEMFLEVPPCDIEPYLRLKDNSLQLEADIEDLVQENDDLEQQVQALKAQLFESRSVGEGFRLALAYKDDGSVEEVEFPILEDVKAAVELAGERFRDRLLFQCNSESTIENNPFKWPEQVWNALEWLATSYYDSRIGLATNPDLDVSCREASGMWYKTSQHDNTMALYRNAYTTRVNGRIIWLGEHIGKGTGFDPRRTIRIGFDWDRALQRVIIGYIGRHQTTSAS